MKSIVVYIFFLVICPVVNGQRKVSVKAEKTAVLVIGSRMDSDDSESQMEKIELFLDSIDFKVHTFYDPYNSWDEIKKASEDASIFIYKGHGTHLGIDGGFGGIVIDEFVSGKRIADELKFKNSPLVMFISVCGGAGSSAGDETDIGISEAQNRVFGSALPFLLVGAKGYYANNYESGVLSCLKLLSENKTLGEAYEITATKWTKIELIEPIDDNRVNINYEIGISSKKEGGKSTINHIINEVKTYKQIVRPKNYSIAFAGDPNYRLNQTISLSNNK
jgi:hypothetical protein